MSTHPQTIAAPDVTKERDPVCGMTVRADSPHHTTFEGRTYRFCSAGCLAKFTADPRKYLSPTREAEHAQPMQATEYTCPMHPEIRQPKPGACPKCGMALEPVHPTAPSHKIEWTCPMHPQIVRDGPGSCPLCGMALEPRTVTLGELENPELTDMRRRFWVCVGFTTPL